MTCRRVSKIGRTNGRLISTCLNREGSATARPIVFVPKLGYTEKTSDKLSKDGIWNAYVPLEVSFCGRGILYGPELTSRLVVMTSLSGVEVIMTSFGLRRR